MVMRIILLFAIFYVMRLTAPLFTVPLLTELEAKAARRRESLVAQRTGPYPRLRWVVPDRQGNV